MTRANISGFRFGIIVLTVLVCFGALAGRLAFLHVVDAPRLERIVQRNRDQIHRLPARRGEIVDRDGNLLATTRAVYEVGLDPHVMDELSTVHAAKIAALLGTEARNVRAATEQRFRTVNGPDGPEPRPIRWRELADGVDEDTYQALIEYTREENISGVYGNRKFRRVYPGSAHAAHVVGFVNREGIPSNGIEQVFNFYLRGQEGWRESERDGRRHELAQFRGREVLSRPGLNVELTLDTMVQHFAEEELARIEEEFSPASASIIVSDVASGEILALATLPGYDLNHFWQHDIAVHKNRAMTDVFEPGSTFKIVAAAGALEDGLVQPDTEFDVSEYSFDYGGKTYRLPRDHRTHQEPLSVEEIVVKSSNRGAAQLGILLGEQRLHEWTQKFGFGAPTQLRLPGESRGILHDPADWDGLTITRLPMGHAISATAVQVHQAMAVIATGGVLQKPLLVRRVFDENGETVLVCSSAGRERVLSRETAETMAGFLNTVVSTEGTARRAIIEHYEVAGKTGTTQKIVDGRYVNDEHVASFTGFFPASRPRLVITVVVDDAQLDGTAYGGLVAAPAFRNVALKCIHHLGIPPVEHLVHYETALR